MASQQGLTETAFFIFGRSQTFGYGRLLFWKIAKFTIFQKRKKNQKTSKARVKLFLIFFRKSGKILHSKQYVNHLIDWAVNGHSVGSSWIYSLFLSSNMYWWRTIYSWVVCFFTPECGLTLPSFLLCLLKIIQKNN